MPLLNDHKTQLQMFDSVQKVEFKYSYQIYSLYLTLFLF